jgi:hypothetical protein
MNVSNSTDSEAKNWCVKWGGSHSFFVYGNGWIYSRGQFIGSDSVFKENIEEIKNPLEKLLQLHGVMFNSKKTEGNPDTVRFQDKFGKWHIMSPNQFDNLDTTKFNVKAIKRLVGERKMKHLGLIAQEVEKIIPELVRVTPDGTLAVEYYSIIGLLIEAMKEQNNMINNYYQNPANKVKSKPDKETLRFEEENVLFQNKPNPFKNNCLIKYKVALSRKDATIMIFDMQGSLIKSYKDLKDEGEITIFGNELKPGMYFYSLVVDGKEIDTLRMILTD